MKHLLLRPFVVLLLPVALLSACSGPPESTSNANASQQANSNSADQPGAPRSDAPPTASNGTPLAVQPIPAPPKAAGDAARPAEKSPSDRETSTAGTAPSPKLVAPVKKIDFGKQPKDKTLIRAIAIRNGGRANLNIESVTPS